MTGSRVSLSVSTRVRGMNWTGAATAVLESPGEDCGWPHQIRWLVSIYSSQFGFVPGRGTIDAIFGITQLQEKYLAANKRLYMAFVELEKAVDRVPQKAIWWALRKLVIDEWIVPLVQGM